MSEKTISGNTNDLVDQTKLFDADFFSANRAKLKNLFVGSAPIVVTANGLLQQSMDTTYPFSQDGNFWYLTGIDEPDIILVLDKDKEYLIVPEQSQSKQNFDGVLDYTELSRISGVATVLDQKTGWKQLSNRIAKVKHLATLAPSPIYIESMAFYTNPARAQLTAKIKELNPSIEFLDLRQHFAKMRMVKQPQELKAIKHAIAVTIESLNYLKSKLGKEKYQYEYQIEADLSYRFKNKYATTHGFEPIIANGPNACVVHYNKNNGRLNSKQLLLFDVGAQYAGYSADISRTYSINSNPSRRQKQVHQAVVDVQEYAYSLLTSGVILSEYEQKIEQYMGEKLRTLGLIKIVERQEIRKYFPHSTSHHLGYDVHDMGIYDQPLQPGNVITVEPGIYIAEEGIGVRIEDDVLITEDGIEVLTNKLSKDLC